MEKGRRVVGREEKKVVSQIIFSGRWEMRRLRKKKKQQAKKKRKRWTWTKGKKVVS